MSRLLPLEEPAFLYPARTRARATGAEAAGILVPEVDDPDADLEEDERPPARGVGPLATLLSDVPALGDGAGAVVALEVLSRQPYDLFECRDGEWFEVRVAAGDDELAEILVPAPPPEGATPCPPVSAGRACRWIRMIGGVGWLRTVLGTASGGTLAVIERWPAGPAPGTLLDLGQLRPVREPAGPGPESIPGTPLSAVRWRLG